jgi:hypothetical protein
MRAVATRLTMQEVFAARDSGAIEVLVNSLVQPGADIGPGVTRTKKHMRFG